MIRPRYTAAALLTSLALAGLTGCGSGGEPDAQQKKGAGKGAAQADLRDMELKFAQCLRKQGLPVPDPTPGGGLEFGGGDRSKLEAARKACRQYDPKGDIDRNDPAFIDRVLKNQQCLRRHGIDAPDPQPGQPPRINLGPGDTEEKVEAARDACREELRKAEGDATKEPAR
ncbi:hypothetical protein [Actinomadura alba]|uniref:Secreted protein n=1 Tax=Actinomadura alba TaxID=406431 RepID=A0ABR7LQE5_9ACTN|nr:hypothetical protein [Actinomadura alba]MBC6466705.1 hypothetical protein [Actinomadura alba]